MTRSRVIAEVATVWTSPDAPRPVDEPAVRDWPDIAAWTTALDASTRLDLHGRTLTQLLRHEPVEILDHGPDGWVRVAAPWQPAPEHPRGYPGWVRAAHLGETAHQPDDRPADEGPPGSVRKDRLAVLAEAGGFVGLRYLWGGLSPHGFDCSGLVHYAYRQAGIIVPRDADAQARACEAVALGDERPGDLYFFARENDRVFHVGFVTGDRVMLHAPEGGGVIEDAPLSPERIATLVAVGRFVGA